MFSPTQVIDGMLENLDELEAVAQAAGPPPAPPSADATAYVLLWAENVHVPMMQAQMAWHDAMYSHLRGQRAEPPRVTPELAEDPDARRARFLHLPHRDADADEGACAICLEKPAKGVRVAILLCQHTMCSECAWHWLKEHSTCPVCRFVTM